MVSKDPKGMTFPDKFDCWKITAEVRVHKTRSAPLPQMLSPVPRFRSKARNSVNRLCGFSSDQPNWERDFPEPFGLWSSQRDPGFNFPNWVDREWFYPVFMVTFPGFDNNSPLRNRLCEGKPSTHPNSMNSYTQAESSASYDILFSSRFSAFQSLSNLAMWVDSFGDFHLPRLLINNMDSSAMMIFNIAPNSARLRTSNPVIRLIHQIRFGGLTRNSAQRNGGGEGKRF